MLPELSSLPARLDELIAAAQPSATALMWGDIKAAGQRKLAALQHAALWTSELQQTTVARPGADPLSHGQAPCLADFQVGIPLPLPLPLPTPTPNPSSTSIRRAGW